MTAPLCWPYGPNAVLGGFAGPGGWDEGARILGIADNGWVGIEFDDDAATAATSAGHQRIVSDIRDIDPADFTGVRGATISSPCPTWSAGGKRSGLRDYQLILDVIACAGSSCDCTWQDRYAVLAEAEDPRTALAAECIRFALGLPDLEWIAMEQVPSGELLFEEIAAELVSFDDGGEDFDADDLENSGTGGGGHGPGWEAVDVFTVDAADFGLPVRRRRTFLVGARYRPLGVRGVADPAMQRHHPFQAPTMAQALGWGTGHRMRTRGARRTSGGNLFSCDGPSWCFTEKARSWTRDADGYRLTSAEAGLLQGFRADYPWSGSRTRQFHQLADVVVPPVAAAVLGYATGTPWVKPVLAHLEGLYGARIGAAA